jgi:hypothetical protein
MTLIQREWTIGENTARFESPDLLHVRFTGICSLQDAVQMVELSQELAAVRPFFLLGDMETAKGIDSEARHYFSERFRPEWTLGIIYFNLRLFHKALVTGLLLATEMAQAEGHALRGKIHFAPTREKAEALLAQLRAQHGADRG